MKKFTVFALMAILLASTSIVKAAATSDDLAVGDPFGEGENPQRIVRHKAAAKKPAANQAAAQGEEQKAGVAKSADDAGAPAPTANDAGK